jgi:hypothetical protein
MRIRLNPTLAWICLAGFVSMPAFAATENSDQAKIDRLSVQLATMQAEIKSLKRQVSHGTPAPQSIANKRTRTHYQHRASAVSSEGSEKPQQTPPSAYGNDADSRRLSARDLRALIGEEREYLPFDLDVPGQAFVSTGPYVGVPLQYAGSNLVINSPSVNTDLQLLGIRKSIQKQLRAMGGEIFKEPYHSHLLFSGVVESQANYTNWGGSPSTTDIDVTNVSLDAFFMGPSEWLLGFIEFSYDGARPVDNYYRVSNSRVFVNKAFVTIGDLALSPIYGTFGQFYVPFGRYSSVMISEPLTKPIGRTKARAIQLGFAQQGDNAFYGAAYVFRGDSHANSVAKVRNGGLNIGYKFSGWLHGDVGAGVIANLADSGGMQLGNGFAYYEQLHHTVPAYNLRGILSFGDHLDLITEWVGASKSFNVDDMSYNGSGAKPAAFDLEGAYSFYAFERPSAFGLGYSHSYQALSLGIPMSRYYMVFNTSIWRNTLQSLELRHDNNYAASSTGNGPVGAAATPGACTSVVCSQTGKSDNAITAQFDYYF